jgi:hypothetical protein
MSEAYLITCEAVKKNLVLCPRNQKLVDLGKSDTESTSLLFLPGQPSLDLLSSAAA